MPGTIQEQSAKMQASVNASKAKVNGAEATSDNLDKILEQVASMDDSNPMKQQLLVALGIEKAPIFTVVRKVNPKTEKPYFVIAVKDAKVQFSIKTARRIQERPDELSQAIVQAEAQEAAEKASK